MDALKLNMVAIDLVQKGLLQSITMDALKLNMVAIDLAQKGLLQFITVDSSKLNMMVIDQVQEGLRLPANMLPVRQLQANRKVHGLDCRRHIGRTVTHTFKNWEATGLGWRQKKT
eukprot:1161698-Pelagomonas_calceolata.AAC.9